MTKNSRIGGQAEIWDLTTKPNRSFPKIKSQFEILSIPYYVVKTDCYEERDLGKANGNMIIGKGTDDKRWKVSDIPKQTLEGQRNTVVSWTLLRLVTYHMSQHGVSVQDMKIIWRVESMMDYFQIRRNFDLIFHE